MTTSTLGSIYLTLLLFGTPVETLQDAAQSIDAKRAEQTRVSANEQAGMTRVLGAFFRG